MTLNRYPILDPADECFCASCGAPIRFGQWAIECDGRAFCSGECAHEAVGRLMGELHTPAAQQKDRAGT